jgi:hypothetical protein
LSTGTFQHQGVGGHLRVLGSTGHDAHQHHCHEECFEMSHVHIVFVFDLCFLLWWSNALEQIEQCSG